MSDALLNLSYATTTEYDPVIPASLAMRPFQRAAVEYGIACGGRVLMADPMGLGKTVEAIGFMNSSGVKQYLVICPASLLDNWKREIEKWSTLASEPYIFTTDGVNPRNSILILSYGLCSNIEILKRILSGYRFDGLVVDEMHMLKGMDSARTKNVLGINGPFDRAGCIACLSGTPIVNKPVDIWPIASRLRPEALGCKNFKEFGETFANAQYNTFSQRTEYVGSKNEEELGRLLRSTMMIRREKTAVLKDLPPKTRRAIYLSADATTSELVSAENAMYDDFLADKKLSLDRTSSSMRVRVQLACLKAPQVIDYIKMILEEEHKVLVFGWHRQLLTEIICGLAKYNLVALTGATSKVERQKRVDAFQNNPDVRLFIGAIPAAGVGLTLTAANHVVMAESSWVPGENVQAEDRAHRMGQINNVVVDYLIYPRSVDERVLQVIGKKSNQIDLVLNSGGWSPTDIE